MTLRDWEEMPEEESDKLFDEMMKQMFEQAKKDLANKPRPAMRIMDPKVIQDVLYMYNTMKELTRGTDAKVTCEFDEACSMASVIVRARSLVVENPTVFLAAVSKMPGFEVSPMIDGTIDFCFSRHRLMIEYDQNGNEIK